MNYMVKKKQIVCPLLSNKIIPTPSLLLIKNINFPIFFVPLKTKKIILPPILHHSSSFSLPLYANYFLIPSLNSSMSKSHIPYSQSTPPTISSTYIMSLSLLLSLLLSADLPLLISVCLSPLYTSLQIHSLPFFPLSSHPL